MGGQTIPNYTVEWADETMKWRRGTITRMTPEQTTNAPQGTASVEAPFGSFLVEWQDEEHNVGRIYLKNDQAATPDSVWSWIMSHGYPTESYPARVWLDSDYIFMLSAADGWF